MHEHQHAHAANPVGQAAPEQGSVRNRFHIGQDGGARSGKARDGLEQRIHYRGDLPAEQEGQCAGDRQHNPAQCDSYKAFTRIKTGVLRFFVAEQPGKCQADHRRAQIGQNDRLLIEDSGQRGQQQENGFHTQHPADQVANHYVIHFSISSSSSGWKISCRSFIPLRVDTTMTVSPSRSSSWPRGMMRLPLRLMQHSSTSGRMGIS